MPELPEVHTTVTGLQNVLPGLCITDVWTDLAKKSYTTFQLKNSHKDKNFFAKFKKEIVGKKVVSVERRAKNILIHLIEKSATKNSSVGKTILIHLKMTGHLMVGKYAFDSKKKMWTPAKSEKNEALRDPYNRFLHVVFSLSNGKQLVLSDVRQFAKVTLVETETLHDSIHFKHIGPEPLDSSFMEKRCIERLLRKLERKIKLVLLDQSIIAGIGNIYSDEMLFLSDIHPMSVVGKIPQKNLSLLYKGMKAVLKKGIDFGGDSTSDYRDITGNRGKFQHAHNVYRRTGKPCPKRGCSGVITKLPFGGRSTHFCPVHQRLFK
jgi:formamidopyrimidine-DNA glycosylase